MLTGFKKGDRVVGECVVRTPERLHHFGFSMSGADREFFAVNPEWLHKLPDAVDDKKAALIEPFTCGFYCRAALGRHECQRNRRRLRRRHHRPGIGCSSDRHGRSRHRRRSACIAPRGGKASRSG